MTVSPPILPTKKRAIDYPALSTNGILYTQYKETPQYKLRIAKLKALNSELAATVEEKGIGHDLDRNGYYCFASGQLCAKLGLSMGDLTTREGNILMLIAVEYAEWVREKAVQEPPF
jgi:hypothetical protein